MTGKIRYSVLALAGFCAFMVVSSVAAPAFDVESTARANLAFKDVMVKNTLDRLKAANVSEDDIKTITLDGPEIWVSLKDGGSYLLNTSSSGTISNVTKKK